MGFATTLTKEEIAERFEQLLAIVKDTFEADNPDRARGLTRLYLDYEQRIKEAPASGKLNFHNAYEGGYLDHILNCVRIGKKLMKAYQALEGWVDFTEAELVFCLLNHDLNKLGTLEEPYYVPQDSEWHRVNRMELFKINETGQYYRSKDRAIFLLQQYGLTMSEREFFGVLMSHGMYDDSNKEYLKQYNHGPYPMQSNLYLLVHWADHWASCIEADQIKKKLLE